MEEEKYSQIDDLSMKLYFAFWNYVDDIMGNMRKKVLRVTAFKKREESKNQDLIEALKKTHENPHYERLFESFFEDTSFVLGRNVSFDHLEQETFLVEPLANKVLFMSTILSFLGEKIVNSPSMKDKSYQGKKFTDMDFQEVLSAGRKVNDQNYEVASMNLEDTKNHFLAEAKSGQRIPEIKEAPFHFPEDMRKLGMLCTWFSNVFTFCSTPFEKLNTESNQKNAQKVRKIIQKKKCEKRSISEREEFMLFDMLVEYGYLLHEVYPESIKQISDPKDPTVKSVIEALKSLGSYKYLDFGKNQK